MLYFRARMTTSPRRRSLDEARAVFRPRTPDGGRQANVDAAMKSGVFHQIRYGFNKDNPKYEMDASGGIRAKPVKSREENIAAAKQDGSFNRKVAAYNKAHPERPMDAETGDLASMVAVPSFGGGTKFVVDRKSVNQSTQGPPRTAMNAEASKEQKPPAAKAVTASPAPVKRGPKGDGTIDGKPAREWFQEAANRQGVRNQYAQPQTPDKIQGPPKSAKPGLQTIGDITAGMDKTIAEAKTASDRLR